MEESLDARMPFNRTVDVNTISQSTLVVPLVRRCLQRQAVQERKNEIGIKAIGYTDGF
jgi:hypothetical protein